MKNVTCHDSDGGRLRKGRGTLESLPQTAGSHWPGNVSAETKDTAKHKGPELRHFFYLTRLTLGQKVYRRCRQNIPLGDIRGLHRMAESPKHGETPQTTQADRLTTSSWTYGALTLHGPAIASDGAICDWCYVRTSEA